MEMGAARHVNQGPRSRGFDPRESHDIMKRRYTHDVVTAVCLFILLPAAVVVSLVYVTMMFKEYVYSRETKRLIVAFALRAFEEIPERLGNLAGVPALLGVVLFSYYVIIFYFNSDVPGVKPPLPRLSLGDSRVDSNYVFAALLAIFSVMLFSVSDLVAMHASRIYS